MEKCQNVNLILRRLFQMTPLDLCTKERTEEEQQLAGDVISVINKMFPDNQEDWQLYVDLIFENLCMWRPMDSKKEKEEEEPEKKKKMEKEEEEEETTMTTTMTATNIQQQEEDVEDTTTPKPPVDLETVTENQ